MTRNPDDWIERLAPAKINWFLEILRRRDDGFHEIRTVMQMIDWCDTVRVRPREDGQIRFTCSVAGLPTNDDNLVVKAALLLREAAGDSSLGADLHLEKETPWAAGLGGGSSDAAATLLALKTAWELELAPTHLDQVASQLGSDVSFFLHGPLALCEGRGELVTPLQAPREQWLALVWPGFGVSTPSIYRSGTIDLTEPRRFDYLALRGIDSTGIRHTPFCCFNRLQEPCFELFETVRACFARLKTIAGDRETMLSGSGSSMFVVCEDESDGLTLLERMTSEFPPPARVKLARTLKEAPSNTWWRSP